MEVEPTEQFKEVIDWDFTFNNNYRLPISIDEGVGDSVAELPDRYVVTLAEKPSLSDPEDLMPAEIATVFKSSLLTVVVRKRKQRIPTAEEQLNLRKFIHKVPKQAM